VGAVHQFIPTYSSRDAIGTHARHVRDILRGLGMQSEIYAEGISPGVRRGDAHLFKSFPATSDALLLYQLSTGCKMADWLLSRPERTVVNYHNVTPFTVFGAWEPIVGAELRRGREQLADFARRAEAGIAVSHYNEGELREAGFERTAVAPVLVDLDALAVAPDAAALDRLHAAKARGGADWLFVGRVAPHKCQHDLVKAFALYRRVYDPKARLHIVGASASHAYSTALERYIRALGLHRNVHLHGSVPDGVLAAHYASADAFVCLSMHEGFCVPLIEAMRNRLPIVAHAAAAVPETLAGAGVLLDLKDPATVAAAAHRVTTDAPLREELTEAGLRRAGDFAFEQTRRRFVTVMEDLLAAATAPTDRSGGGIVRHGARFPHQNEGGGRG
jgi:glycosyltransferase involved in cell wall biosynthesis